MNRSHGTSKGQLEIKKDNSISMVVIFGFLFGVMGFALRFTYVVDPEKFIEGTTLTLNEFWKLMADMQVVLIALMITFFCLTILGAVRYFQLRDQPEINNEKLFYKQPIMQSNEHLVKGVS